MRAQNLRQRARLLRAIRAFFDTRDFVEIEAPVLVHSPGLEPHLDAFEVKTGTRRYLHTSPEYALKRLLGTTDLARIYSLGPCFRDEHASDTHSPEFTLLEWYETGLDLFGLMDQTEALIIECAGALGVEQITRDGAMVALDAPFERLSVQEAFTRYAGVDPWEHTTAQALKAAAIAAGQRVDTDSPAWDDVFFQIFLNAVEPQLGRERPVFLWGYPPSQAALARLDPEQPSRALRFELFAAGLELCNAFDELIDPVEQRRRFEIDLADRRDLGRPLYPIDEPLLEALAGMRPTCGIAVGVDRLAMLLLGVQRIDSLRAQPW